MVLAEIASENRAKTRARSKSGFLQVWTLAEFGGVDEFEGMRS